MTHKWTASEYDMPSKVVSIETPMANVRVARAVAPPGTCRCHVPANVNNGPQKNPNPINGRIVKNVRPKESVFPGQISPKPTMNINKQKIKFHEKIREMNEIEGCANSSEKVIAYVVNVMTEQ